MFTLGSNPLFADSWERQILSENASVLARLDAFSGVLSLSIFPAVTKDADHLGKRETAGVYFEIAAKIAEKVNGTIIQGDHVAVALLVLKARGVRTASVMLMLLSGGLIQRANHGSQRSECVDHINQGKKVHPPAFH